MVAVGLTAQSFALSPSLNGAGNEAVVPACSAGARRMRIQGLRRAIESGEYHVSAADLADALLRAARSSN